MNSNWEITSFTLRSSIYIYIGIICFIQVRIENTRVVIYHQAKSHRKCLNAKTKTYLEDIKESTTQLTAIERQYLPDERRNPYNELNSFPYL